MSIAADRHRVEHATVHAGMDSLFPACVLPGCRNLVEAIGRPCNECRGIFGPMLQHNPEGVPMTSDQIIARDIGTRAAYVRMLHDPTFAPEEDVEDVGEPDERSDAECWLCDAETLCQWTSMGWECDTCREGES